MLDKNNIPRHIAIIMDGNGRWATKRRLPRSIGHREGIERIKEIVKAAKELGVKFLTLFAFSTENWKRPRKEIDMLMRSLESFLKKRIKELKENDICFRAIGRLDGLPLFLQKRLKEAMRITQANKGIVLQLALNYGGRAEILDAAKKIAKRLSQDELDKLSEEGFKAYLYSNDVPDPDLLIRTAGEKRVSNFLLWQISYTELYFSDKFWPDFNKLQLASAIKDYQTRIRRFGAIK